MIIRGFYAYALFQSIGKSGAERAQKYSGCKPKQLGAHHNKGENAFIIRQASAIDLFQFIPRTWCELEWVYVWRDNIHCQIDREREINGDCRGREITRLRALNLLRALIVIERAVDKQNRRGEKFSFVRSFSLLSWFLINFKCEQIIEVVRFCGQIGVRFSLPLMGL